MATVRLDRKKQKRIRKEENTYQSGSKTRVEAGNQRSRQLKVEERAKLFDFRAQRRNCVQGLRVLMTAWRLRCVLTWEIGVARGGTPLRVAIRAAIDGRHCACSSTTSG